MLLFYQNFQLLMLDFLKNLLLYAKCIKHEHNLCSSFGNAIDNLRAWGGVVVKALRSRDRSAVVSQDFLRGIRQFHVPGVDSAS
jgi:hypothetical protein